MFATAPFASLAVANMSQQSEPRGGQDDGPVHVTMSHTDRAIAAIVGAFTTSVLST